jgi:tetratricopeptide (TPR) repeat protein
MKRRSSFATVTALFAVTLVVGAEEPSAPSPVESAPAAAPAPAVVPLDASLTKTLDVLRRGPLGEEHDAVAYMDLIAGGGATPAQVNDFAAYVAKRGMPKAALTIQEHAIHMDPNNATLWANLGTIRRTSGSLGPAVTAYKKAIAIDPGNALAHYNLGAVYDAQKNYDDAIEEYRRALVLDPDLADPRKNPQVVNNENLLAVKLQIYSNQAGSMGLPLLQMQKEEPKAKPAPVEKKP